MAITSGFFNSVDHDRAYDAMQFSSVFDGIINDGIFMSIGGNFVVKASSGMTVNVSTGRAWFDHSWILSDSLYPLTLDQEPSPLDRWDAIVLETNWDEAVRENSIKIVKGTPGTNPEYPTLTKSTYVNQYPLAYIKIYTDTTAISQAQIMNMVGTSDTPFVTGIIETINIDDLVAQWGAEWTDWSNSFHSSMNSWRTTEINAFNKWYDGIKDILDKDVAAKLASQVSELQTGKENKSTSILYELTTSKWSNKEYSLESEYSSSTYDVEIQPSSSMSTEQFEAWGLAGIVAKSDLKNVMICKGSLPKVNLPVILTYRKR